MEIDKASSKVLSLALYLNKLKPGALSALWIDPQLVKQLLSRLPRSFDLEEELFDINSVISLLTDKRRKVYLNELVNSITYQLKNADIYEEPNIPEFVDQCFGINVDRVTDSDLKKLDAGIEDLEDKLRAHRIEIIERNLVNKNSTLKTFRDYIEFSRSKIIKRFDFPEQEQIDVEAVSRRAWAAFNDHTKPFVSKIKLNTDFKHTKQELFRMAVHEGYGGHHTELTLKDKMLAEGKGEFGFVLTFSPQAFMSEAIAESGFEILGLRDGNREDNLVWQYYRLSDALLNYAAFKYFDDNADKEAIRRALAKYKLRQEDIDQIIKFATDPKWGRYTLVYYQAFQFLKNLYDKVEDKDALIKEIYTQPVTAKILTNKYIA